MPDLFTLQSDAIPPSARVVGFKAHEALSTPFKFEIGFMLLHGVDMDLQASMGAKARLIVDRGMLIPPFLWAGMLAGVELIHEFTDRTLFVATFVPQLWTLSLNFHSRVYTDRTVPEIVTDILQKNGLTAFEFRLSKAYPKHEHTCQYRETDLAFVSRLLEREGIYYYFEHTPETDLVVLTDDMATHQPLPLSPVKYDPGTLGNYAAGEAFGVFKNKLSVVSANVRTKDYDYLKPNLDVSGTSQVPFGTSGDVVLFGENFLTPNEGARYAAIRSDELRAHQNMFSAHGRVFEMRPGYLFTLEEHPRPIYNATYNVVAVDHRGNDTAGNAEVEQLLDLTPKEIYLSTVTAVTQRTQYRHPRVTPWPRVDGVVHALVDGPGESPYAQIDEHGRYKVRILFDELQLPDGSASTWVRMLQPHGGNPEGHHFPLRKQTEVLLTFLGGDPDRPVIVGAIPNMLKPSVVTSANISQNVIHTKGNNRLEMEDRGGGQYVTLSSPTQSSFLHLGAGDYNAINSTQGNGLYYYGGNLDAQVIGDMTEDVTGSLTETYLSTQTTTVTGAVTQTYESTHDVTVTGAVTNIFESTLTENVTGAVAQSYSSTHSLTVGGTQTSSVTGAVTETYSSTLSQTVTGDVTEKHLANKLTQVSGTQTDHAAGLQMIHSDSTQQIDAPTQNILATTQNIESFGTQSIKVAGAQTNNVGSHTSTTGGAFTISAGPTFSASAAEVNVGASGNNSVSAGGTLALDGATITVNGGTVTITGGGATVSCAGGIVKLN